MEKWYQKLRAKTDYILEAIFQHRFIKKLLAGKLDLSTFIFYVQQDVLYLSEYRRVLAVLGARLHQTEHSKFFIDSANNIVSVEGEVHDRFLKGRDETVMHSPTCELYTSYLSRIVNTQAVEVGIAAVLPCFTIYREVGNYILKNQKIHKNPYQDWIDTYGSEAFSETTNTAIEICNFYAEATNKATQLAMEKAFVMSSKLEWMFWDSAYEKEQWKI